MNKTFHLLFSISLLGLILFVVTPQSSYAGETTEYAGSVLRTSVNWCCNSNAILGSGSGSCYGLSGSDFIRLGGYGFSIPASNVITGIKVEIKIRSSFASTARLLREIGRAHV